MNIRQLCLAAFVVVASSAVALGDDAAIIVSQNGACTNGFATLAAAFESPLLQQAGVTNRIVVLRDTDDGRCYTNAAGNCCILDLNGHVVKGRHGSYYWQHPVGMLNNYGTLIVDDGSNAKSGRLSGGDEYRGIVNEGCLVLRDGTIADCFGDNGCFGGLYNVAGATFEMDGGAFTNCTSWDDGGAAVLNEGEFIMNGGVIDDCYVKSPEGPLCAVYSLGVCIINGGAITNCKTYAIGAYGELQINDGVFCALVFLYSGRVVVNGGRFADVVVNAASFDLDLAINDGIFAHVNFSDYPPAGVSFSITGGVFGSMDGYISMDGCSPTQFVTYGPGDLLNNGYVVASNVDPETRDDYPLTVKPSIPVDPVETPTVSSVAAQQRYPWNGLVDITVTLQGSKVAVNGSDCLFAATNSATKAALPVVHITPNGADTGSGTTWTRKYIWDTHADVGAVKIDDVALVVNVVGAVQLWENGPYWAPCNVGATKPEEYGYYFWWGDTVGYKRNLADNGWVSVKDGSSFSFSTENCPTYNRYDSLLQSMGYIDSTRNLVAAHDAATAHLGAPWRMPTDAEISALISRCTTTWITTNGVPGRLVTGKGTYASKSIFLPAAGFGDDSGLYGLGSLGRYWSSTPDWADCSYNALGLYFDSSNFGRDGNRSRYYYRYNGQSVRPVRGFAPATGVAGGVSTHFSFDCLTGDRASSGTETLTFSNLWDGDSDATVTIAQDGTAIFTGLKGEGTKAWTVEHNGRYVLTHTTYANGVASKVETAAFVVTGKEVPVEELTIGWGQASFVYDGQPKTPVVTVKDGATTLTKGTHYLVEYQNNVNVGTAKTIVTGVSPYVGAVTNTFTITKATYDMSGAKWSYTAAFTYDKTAKTVTVTGLPSGVTVSGYGGNAATAAGNYTATVTLAYDTANYNAPTLAACNWKINPKPITVTAAAKSQVYGASAVPLTYTATGLCSGDSLSGTLTRAPGDTVNTYAITLGTLANSNYAITFVGANYTITKATYDMSGAKWSYTAPFTYDGQSHAVTVTGLPSGVSVGGYLGNTQTAAGTYTATVSLLGADAVNYEVPTLAALEWKVNSRSISDGTVTLAEGAHVYTGAQQTQGVASVIVGGLNATYSVSGNTGTDAGTYTLTVTGTGNFSGTLTKTWTIAPATIVASATAYDGTYDGSGHGVAVTVTKPAEGADVVYALAKDGPYVGNGDLVTNVSETAVWYVVTAPNYAALTNSAVVRISAKALAAGMIPAIDPQAYTGVAVEPAVTLSDKAVVGGVERNVITADDYTLSYANNIEVGTASVTVTGRGNYTGSVTRQFAITSPAAEDLADAVEDIGEMEPDGHGGWVVTLTNDVVETLEIGDNLGKVTLDLKGRNLVGKAGSTGDAVSVAGGDGEPAIRIAATGKDGSATVLTIVDSVPDDTDDVIGGRGGDGTPGGNGGAAVEVVGEAKAGVKINVGEGVGVRGGAGGTDLSGNSRGGNGGAGIDGDVGTNDGSIAGGQGGDSANGTAGDGGSGVTGNVDVNNGSIAGGDGGASVSGTGGNGGSGVGGSVGRNDGEVAGGKGGSSETGTPGEDSVAVEGEIGGGIGKVSKVEIEVPTVASKTFTGALLTADIADTDRYTVSGNVGWISAGTYSILVTLRDPQNYCWRGVSGMVAGVSFTIEHGITISGGNGDGTSAGTIAYSGTYDGSAHGISVQVTEPLGAAVTYALAERGPYSAQNPQFTDVCSQMVWFVISAEGYASVSNCATVTITPRNLMNGDVSDLSFVEVGGVRTPRVTLVDDLGNVVNPADYEFTWEESATGALTLTFAGRRNYRGTCVKKFAQTRFKVTYAYNGGSGGPEFGEFDLATYYGTALPQPTKPGYLFDGWYESPTFEKSTLVTRNTEVIAEDLTLYAKWNRRALWYTDSPFHVESAATWDGYIIGRNEASAGTLQVKVGKPNKKTGVSKVSAVLQLTGVKKQTMKGTTFDGSFEAISKDGRRLRLQLSENGLTGDFDGMPIDGARNLFTAKDADSKLRAAQALKRWQGTYVAVMKGEAGYGGLSLAVGKKGAVKVKGTLASGTKVSGRAQLMVGERECALSFSWAKKGATVSFLVWFCEDGSVEISNLDNPAAEAQVANQKDGAYLPSGSAFRIDAEALAVLLGPDLLGGEFLPDGEPVVQNGSKWSLAKAGKVKSAKGEIVATGENLSGLKLSYKLKDSTFKGSFSAYVVVNGKLKKTKFSVSGVVLGGKGYGTATVKKVGSVPVIIE